MVFQHTEKDNQRPFSFEDETFLKIIEKEVHQDKNNNWITLLSFKSPHLPLQTTENKHCPDSTHWDAA